MANDVSNLPGLTGVPTIGYMSHKALLFCPEEATAKQITQVLSELDFTVELSFEPFVTVKKLADEAFDALVVDCSDEQNAALLFKGARNSALNHNSLCVAVAEGQAGVAKAFRIGANLVLTKPINIEQSKGTLKVARGLLRKSDGKPRPTPTEAGSIAPPSPAMASASSLNSASSAISPVAAAAAAANSSSPSGLPLSSPPSSLLDAEQKKTATESSEKISHDSSPAVSADKPTTIPQTSIPVPKTDAPRPVVASGSAAAAPALAPDDSDISKDKAPGKWAPVARTERLAITDPIVPEKRYAEPERPLVPTFSSYTQHSTAPRKVGSKGFQITVFFLIFGSAGYVAWQKYQPLQHLPDSVANLRKPASPVSQEAESGEAKPSPGTTMSPEQQSSSSAATGPDQNTSSDTGPASMPATSAPEGFPTKETIVVGEPAEAPQPITVVSKPLRVRQKALAPTDEPTPPPIQLPNSGNSDQVLTGIVATNVALPRPEPGTLRLSQGITQGLLIRKVSPTYPQMALQVRKEGTVELLATISKAGMIEKIKVLAGDATLAQSAVNAVKQWTYRPYLLNGEPVEIETQITIVFRLPR